MRPSLEPMAPAPTHTTSPEVHSASRSAGSCSGRRARRMSRSSADATRGAPWSCATTSTRASMPRRAWPMPCQRGRKRASVPASTGSTSLRRAASDRRRSWRSTSLSHHSRSTPSGRNSPRTTRPSRSSTSRAARDRFGAQAVASGGVRHEERAVGAGVAGHQVDDRRGHRLGAGVGQADGHRHAEGVAQPAGVLGRAHPLLAGDDGEERPALGDELVDPLLHRGAVDRPQPELVERQRAEQPELVVRLVDVAGQCDPRPAAGARARGRPARRRRSARAAPRRRAGRAAGRGRGPARRPGARPAARRRRTCRRRSTRT